MTEVNRNRVELGGEMEEPKDVSILYAEGDSLLVPGVDEVVLTPEDYILKLSNGCTFIRSRPGIDTIGTGPEVSVSRQNS